MDFDISLPVSDTFFWLDDAEAISNQLVVGFGQDLQVVIFFTFACGVLEFGRWVLGVFCGLF